MLPKNMSESLVRKLNDACDVFSEVCAGDCDNIGWCETCWIVVESGSPADGAGKIANNVESDR